MLGGHPHVAGGFSDDVGAGLAIEDVSDANPGFVPVEESTYRGPDSFTFNYQSIEKMKPKARTPKAKQVYVKIRTCRVCGCTDLNCRQCIEKTGEPCHWVEQDLCSACL
jgi:hypothetical protein